MSDQNDPDFIEHSGIDQPGHKGNLHRALGIPEDRDIPKPVLRAAAHSKNHKLAREARMAEVLERMPHPKGHEPPKRK